SWGSWLPRLPPPRSGGGSQAFSSDFLGEGDRGAGRGRTRLLQGPCQTPVDPCARGLRLFSTAVRLQRVRLSTRARVSNCQQVRRPPDNKSRSLGRARSHSRTLCAALLARGVRTVAAAFAATGAVARELP